MNQANEPAFPSYGTIERFDDDLGKYVETPVTFDGLTKREYFAAMAMQGLCVNQPDHFDLADTERRCRIATLALQAVEHADALLAELEKKK